MEFTEETARSDADATLTSVAVPDALAALKAGDGKAHDQLIAQAAANVRNADAIVLAHFSMSRAADAVRACTDIPVLTSPDAAIDKLKRVLAPANAKGTLEC
ncbi:aspartate/glutamate racemase family protein [Phaeobacter sp. J2-8]|uniref:aspartate/glutamate racemase family protein n=1 Tax=Phaeobacter sp. J2-8 TaxID=2931394 RepID=UPI001FD1AD49|nr:aspartate/glutamate racemase family protein [Phaeobacter sp. J2-8]MCJ7872804.1 hypothetical protein [Phaeobacter sp. J2-8]